MIIRGVKTTPLAESDLDEIWFSIATDSVERADKFLDRLTERFVLLSKSPRAGRARSELLPGLRSFSYRGYAVFYSLSDDGVLVERVLHGARDVDAIFRSG
ncbi:MAG: type II toxin-antitoxin system RelE/ParE family toxin [Micropepsaceae bacterium]